MRDCFDLPLTTQSSKAVEHYNTGVSLFLSAQAGVEDAFEAALNEDPGLALAHIGLARQAALFARRDDYQGHIAKAEALSANLSDREKRHIRFHALMLGGKPAEAFEFASDQHLREYPRDGLVSNACIGVFSLIGFSGRPARDAENLAFVTRLEPFAKQDWWFQAQLGFAQLETGLFSDAEKNLEKALATNPASAHTAHVYAHFMYETGQSARGRNILDDFMGTYDPRGMMICHNSWHQALWAMIDGDISRCWELFDYAIGPGAITAPPINIATDAVALLFRLDLAGHEVTQDRWKAVSDYAVQNFGKPGMGFADLHSALSHAMAGENERLATIVDGAKGPVAPLVSTMGRAFAALHARKWQDAIAEIEKVIAQHVRFGGSNAQRDLIEFALVYALIQRGSGDEARRLLARRRPNVAGAKLIEGLELA